MTCSFNRTKINLYWDYLRSKIHYLNLVDNRTFLSYRDCINLIFSSFFVCLRVNTRDWGRRIVCLDSGIDGLYIEEIEICTTFSTIVRSESVRKRFTDSSLFFVFTRLFWINMVCFVCCFFLWTIFCWRCCFSVSFYMYVRVVSIFFFVRKRSFFVLILTYYLTTLRRFFIFSLFLSLYI